ncbi:MAG: type II secretion system protein GspD [Spirochaetes bacterium]|nr:type II secretion system protein GspD [Spirochaetota bacterium]
MKADKRFRKSRIPGILMLILCTAFFRADTIINNISLKTSGNSILFAKTKYFTLNFKDADITEFLNVMSQLIGKNIIVDDKVRGKITISSVKKFPVSEAYEILKSILEVKGLAVIETPSLIKIIPVKEAIKKNAEIIIDGEKQEMKLGEEKTQTYLLTIENTDANDIASALKSLKSSQVDVVLVRTQNMIILSGISSEINGLVKIAKELDKKPEEEEEEKIVKGNIHIVHLENADAEQLAGVLARIPFSENAKIDTSPQTPKPAARTSAKARRTTGTQQVATPKKDTTKLSIIANKETNSLIITATPEEFREIRRVIKELDTVREQVLIEALIVEISADKSWGLGIDWMLGAEAGGDMIGGSSIMGVPPNYTSTTGVPDGKKLALPLAQGFQLGFLSGESALGFALLSLSETDQNFNVLSTPQILTIDNHEAELNIGEEIPVTSNTRITDTGTQYDSYEYKSVGIKLKLTPHITQNSRITLDLYQEANDVLSSGSTTTLPTLTKRDIQTKVTITDGKTIVIGGLIKNNKSEVVVKVPFLGDIPILGWLFKRKDVSYKKTNLLVFITPHIVTQQDRIDAITEQKREEQKRLRIK